MRYDVPREPGGKKALKCTIIFRCLCRKEQFETFGNTCPQLSQGILSLVFLLYGRCALAHYWWVIVLLWLCRTWNTRVWLNILGGIRSPLRACQPGKKALSVEKVYESFVFLLTKRCLQKKTKVYWLIWSSKSELKIWETRILPVSLYLCRVRPHILL